MLAHTHKFQRGTNPAFVFGRQCRGVSPPCETGWVCAPRLLRKPGTPVDRTVHASLEAIEAIHVDWHSGGRMPGQSVSADEVRHMDLKPKAVTAALIGHKSKLATFRLQRVIHEHAGCCIARAVGIGCRRRNSTQGGRCHGRGDSSARHSDHDPDNAQ